MNLGIGWRQCPTIVGELLMGKFRVQLCFYNQTNRQSIVADSMNGNVHTSVVIRRYAVYVGQMGRILA